MYNKIRYYNKRKTARVKKAPIKPEIVVYDPNKFAGLSTAKKLKMV